DHRPPAQLVKACSRLRGIEPVRLEALERGPRDQIDRTGEQDVAARELVGGAGMAWIVGAVDDASLLATVVGKPLLEMQDPDRLFPRRDERDVLALAHLIGGGASHGEGDGQRPWKP